jgi:hypothetical protein
MDLIRTIVLLCSAASARDSADYIEKIQLKCQQYYVKCLENTSTYKDLSKCIKERLQKKKA